MESYEDIINLPHFEPKYHPRMDAYSRAAQFAPFKALIGYEDDIKETSRLTDKKIEINEDKKKQMNENLFFLKENIKESKYSLKDLRKINVYEYNFKDDKSKDLQIGVIAQELKKIIPQAVTINPFNGYLAVDTSWVMYTVVNSVKELDLKVQKISASLNSYAKEFVSLATRVEKLEKEVLMLERENKYLTSQVNTEYKKVKAKGK